MSIEIGVQILTALIAFWGIYLSRNAQKRSKETEMVSRLLIDRQLQTLTAQVKNEYKSRLAPLYGKGPIVDEAKSLIASGADPMEVIQALIETIREKDERVDRANRRIHKWKAELIDYATQKSKN